MIMRYSVNTDDLTLSASTKPEEVNELAGAFPNLIYFVVNVDTDITPEHLCYSDPYKPHKPTQDCVHEYNYATQEVTD